MRSIRIFLAAALLVRLSAGFVYADREEDLAILAAAYPDVFEILPGWGIRFPDGTLLPYDDGEQKDFETLLENPDLEDMLSLRYPPGGEDAGSPPAKNYDPGRFRPNAFFRALYGKDEGEIRAGLRAVQWMPSLGGPRLLVSTRFGIDEKLEQIIAELEALGPEYRRYLMPPGGSFNYRPITGTDRLSPHSFGIAVDIATGPSHYWLWERTGIGEYKNSIPRVIVEIFEKHGFIWGGAWRHFDTMHFEYRPELLLKAR
ncbi:MAG: M15 family metallopeptidase, partial [Treponema sp.]|nr:M15 family metallopeptidase [Treponema sp.]